MTPIETIIDGYIVKIIYNDLATRYKRYSKNMHTGVYVAELIDGKVETNFTGASTELESFMFSSINSLPVVDNNDLFNKLEAFL